ncbi:hypothetical protein Pryu01_03059 [Paraliobacillus ryukyuensis]|uniref:Prophage pi2 protein 38 n=1 Tax=Paraliobacillus ryukyuensis TaxID=200904 RepID=A0A366DQD5_9BACI|nr:hypothetical protein [Paraliobacillus ryukyuensis]RBO92290.1 hypothetical protein DES48_11528 [Paraliobacillus ryukyuensis]
MTLLEFINVLESTGLPVAHSHFENTDVNPAPNPPYLIYLDDETSNFIADNKVYHSVRNPTVELYTNKKDIAAEQAVETAFNDNELPFEVVGHVYIESEQMFQLIYSIGVI